MKKLIALIAMMALSQAFAAPYDLYLNQMNMFGSGTINRQLSVPNSGIGVDGVLFYNGTSTLPAVATLGSGCSIVSSVFTCSGTAQVNADWNAGAGVAQILNKPTAVSAFTNDAGYRTQAQVRSDISLTTTGSGTATYNSGTGALNVPTPAIPAALSQSAASRTLNTVFQVSASRPSLVSYSVRIVTTASIGGNQDGDVILEIASDSGFTANVQTLAITQNAQAITLAIVLNSVQTQTGVLSGFVPTGYYARLRTVNNTGTPSYLYRAGQEILM